MVHWRQWSWDPLAATSTVITFVMIGVYIGIISQQDGEPAVWFLGGLVVAVLLTVYGVVRSAPGQRPALWASGVLLVLFGLVGILSIGLPIVVAGVLSLVSAAGKRPAGPGAGVGHAGR